MTLGAIIGDRQQETHKQIERASSYFPLLPAVHHVGYDPTISIGISKQVERL